MLGSGATVKGLIVEDEPEVLKLARRMLKHNGFKALEADTPTAALSLAKAYPLAIDLLRTNVVMPKMSGTRLARQLHKLRPNMSVVYMSAYTSVRFGRKIDPYILLLKPFSEETITIKLC